MSSELKPCPACPDGSVWTVNGPTSKTCPVCNGYAVVNLDGSATNKAWSEEMSRARLERIKYNVPRISGPKRHGWDES